jgi:hypothetical protein
MIRGAMYVAAFVNLKKNTAESSNFVNSDIQGVFCDGLCKPENRDILV